MKYTLFIISVFANVALLTVPALAQAETSYPALSGEAIFEVQLEQGVDSDDVENERNTIFGRVEVAPTLQFNEHVFIDGVAVLEPVQDFDAGDDIFFENEGIFIEEIKLNYARDAWSVFVGKFNPSFGTAWDVRGVWGEDFAEDYEITEKIGFGATYSFGADNVGMHTLTASSFFADTSVLTESTITGRGRVRESDGGASNTEDFSSFTLSLDGQNLANIENLSYHLGVRYLAEGTVSSAGGDDEQGFAVAINYLVPVNDALASDVLLEAVKIDHFEGRADDVQYYTASVINRIYDDWNITLAYTQRDRDLAGGTEVNDHVLQLTGGYDFGNGLTLEAGWRNEEVSDIDTDILGGLMRYALTF